MWLKNLAYCKMDLNFWSQHTELHIPEIFSCYSYMFKFILKFSLLSILTDTTKESHQYR